MFATISTVLYDAVRTVEDNWDEMIQAIETGNLPIIPSIEVYRVHLEVSIFPSCRGPIIISEQKYVKVNPSRANELRAIEKGQEGWLKKVWPSLAIITVTLSGPYSTCLPQVCVAQLRPWKTVYISYALVLLVATSLRPDREPPKYDFRSNRGSGGFRI